MKLPYRWCTLLLILSGGALPAAELGVPAPPLKITSWIKGKPIDLSTARTNTIHVVEFWATWCGPCRKTIPFLSEIQKRFKDRGVKVVGISSEEPDLVKPFVTKMGAQMDYTVAVDTDRATTLPYLELFGERGIPHAYIVDKDGRIAWQGHPMAGLDAILEEMVAGRYTIEGTTRARNAEPAMQRYFEKAAAGVPADSIRPEGDRILKESEGSTDSLNRMAWVILHHPRIQTRDLDLATRAAKTAFDRTEGKQAFAADTYASALFTGGKIKEAIETQTKALASARPEERPAMEKTLSTYQAALK